MARIPGRSGRLTLRAATRCCSSTRIWRGATRSTGTWEMHQVGPNYNLYGTPQIGFPVPVVGFNRHAGWGRTVNTIDTVDFFKLTIRTVSTSTTASRARSRGEQDVQSQTA